MKLITIAVLIAVSNAAKLDRTYLPPSAATAGGTSDILSLPFSRTNNQGLGGLPVGSYENDSQGVVVDAAVGTRASNVPSGLGGSRISYGSTDSKVGEAAFRDSPNRYPGLNVHNFVRPERIQTSRDRVANIVKFQADISPEAYKYAYETDNGINAEENGVEINGVVSQGDFSYTGDDGQVYSVTYTADKDGYKPMGTHLPTPPPIPAEILKSLEQNAKDEAAGLVDDGSYDANKYNAGGDYTESYSNNEETNKFINGQFHSSGINQNNEASRPNIGYFGFNNQFNKDNVSPGLSNNQNHQSEISKPNVDGFGAYNNQLNKNNIQSGVITDNFGTSKPSEMNTGLASNNFASIHSSFTSSSPTPTNQQAAGLSQSTTIHDKTQIQSNNNHQPPHRNHGGDKFTNVPLSGFAGNNNQESNKQTTGIPLSQQKLQNQNTSPISLSFSNSKPSSYETPITGQPQTNYMPDGNFVKPQEQIIGNFNKPNLNQNAITLQPDMTHTSFGESLTTGSQPITQGDSQEQIGLMNNIFNNPSGSQFSSSSIFEHQTARPTKQPSRDLTTPFEYKPPTTFDNTYGFSVSTNSNTQTQVPQLQETSIADSKPTNGLHQNFGIKEQYFQPSNQVQLSQATQSHNQGSQVKPAQPLFFHPRPTDSYSFSASSFSQVQGADSSYYYNRPSIPFSSPVSQQQYFISKPIGHTQNNQLGGALSSTNVAYNNKVTGIPFNNQPTIDTVTPTPSTINSQNQYSSSSANIPTSLITAPFNQNTQPDLGTSSPTQSFSSQQPSQSNNIGASTFTQSSTFSTGVSQNSEGEIYEYTKPVQSFSATSKPEANSVQQKPISDQGSQQYFNNVQNTFGTQSVNKPLPEINQSTAQNIDINKQNESPILQSNPAESTQYTGQFNTRPPFGSSILGSPCCKSKFQNNPTQFGIKPNFANPNQHLRPQINYNSFKPQSTNSFIGEKFDVNRKPASFDVSGYHY